jgi:hypothetical protein
VLQAAPTLHGALTATVVVGPEEMDCEHSPHSTVTLRHLDRIGVTMFEGWPRTPLFSGGNR